jgi:integrase
MAQIRFKNGKDGVLYAYYVVSKNGKKKWISRGKVLNRKLATREFKAWDRQTNKEEFFGAPTRCFTLEAYFPIYLQWAAGRTLSERGIEFANDRAVHLKRLLGHIKLTDLKPSVIDGYVDHRKRELDKYGRNPAPKTINLDVTLLSSIIVCALKNDVIKKHPFKNDQRPLSSYFLKTSKHIPTVLSKEEIKLMLEAVKDSPHAYCVFICLLLTGMRKGELTNLKWSGVDLAGRTLTFDAAKTDDFRTIPMSEALAQVFGRMKDEYPAQKVWKNRTPRQMTWVFCDEDGNRLKRGLGNFLPRLAKNIGLTKRITPHVLRHSFAAYGRSSFTGFQLQKLLGHRNITTTERYGYVLDESMKTGTENLAGSMGIETPKFALIENKQATTGRPEVDSNIYSIQNYLNYVRNLVGRPGFEPGTKAL